MLILALLGAFKSGSDRYYFKKAINVKTDGRDVFYYFRFKCFVKMAVFYLNLYARRFLILLFCMLPFVVCVGCFYSVVNAQTASLRLTAILIFTCAALFFCGAVFFFRLNSFLFLARYCFVSDEFETNRQIFAFSYHAMNRNRSRLFKRRMAFVPWFASCVFLLPISFVRSYYNQSMAELASEYLQN